jgi:hypothetical protein
MKVLSHFSLAPSLFISEGKFSPNLPPVSLVDPMQPGAPPGAVNGRETARRARVRNPLHGAMAPGTFGLATGLGDELLCPGMSIKPRSHAGPKPFECASNEPKSKGDIAAMKIPASHIERIQQLGYTETEARFPYIVAVFSGYFTMRQFRAFTGSRCGKRPACFAQKLIAQGHARVCAQARNASLFHLFSRTLYGQMDKDNLRNRKRHSFEFMRTRLVLLDFILANQEFAYFETEQDKVDFFCNQLGISKDCLPAKVYEGATANQQTIRYFVDKFPLFLAPPLPDVPPVVTFSYVHSGFERPSSFASHLATYGRLFQQLNTFRFLYIAANKAYFHGAEERFRSLIKRPLEADWSSEILKYFRIQKKWENHEYIIPVTEDLEFLRDARERFRGENMDSLYELWRSGGIPECEWRARIAQEKPERAVFFENYLVNGTVFRKSEIYEQGDRCMKDTDHPSVHTLVHPRGEPKC